MPPLTTVSQVQLRQKRQEVEHVVNQSGTNTATNTDVGGGVHRGSLGNGDWIQLNGPFNLSPDRLGHDPLRGQRQRPHGRLAAGRDRGPDGGA